MFEVVGQDIISGNMGFIGTDSDRLYRMGAAEKTEDVTVTGNPAVLDNATGKPFKDLHIYGRSEQMTTTGAQLFDAASIKKNDKIQVEISDNSYTIQMTTTINESGSPSNRVYIAINHVIEGDFSGKTVTLSYDGVNSDVPNERYVIGLMYNTDDGRTHYLSLQKDMPKSISVTLPENTTNLTLRLFITEFTSPTVPAGTYTVTIQGAMLTEGSEKKDWEPYTGGKPSPSPDYPQEIVSAGEDGNIGVEVHGKNLFGGRFYYANYANDVLKIDENKKENEVKLPFAPTYESFGVCKVIKCQKGKTYVISVTNPNKNAAIGMAEYENIEKAFDINNAFGFTRMNDKILKKSYIAKSDGILVCGIAGKWTDGKTTLHECTESELLQVEEASEATSYEPYHEPQSMSVTTPNGLPGIPVSSGGNYTDENGQQWICDEVDLGRGVYVQRIGILILDDKSSIRSVSKWDNAHLDVVQPYRVDGVAMIKRKVICDRLPSVEEREAWDLDIEMVGGVWFADETGFYLDFYIKNQRLGTTKDTSPDDATTAVLKWLKDNPLSCKYALATPIETPLTAAEIAAYKSLRTYRGTTIVEAEDKAGISATYKCNVKAAEKEVNALYDSLMAEMEELNENSEIV